jgi:hypothetical protein
VFFLDRGQKLRTAVYRFEFGHGRDRVVRWNPCTPDLRLLLTAWASIGEFLLSFVSARMIIGHLPAGYVASKLLFPYFETRGAIAKPFLWAGVLGAFAPDFDMAYFHLIDHRQHHHHSYWTHFPIVWLSLLLVALIWFYSARIKSSAALAVIFTINGFIHLFLDTIVGDIWWLAPFVDKPFALFTVPALYTPWWLNFLLHWSFALELAIVAWAVYLWRISPNEKG